MECNGPRNQPLQQDLEVGGMEADWSDALPEQCPEKTATLSPDELLPPLLKLISTGTYPFLAKGVLDKSFSARADVPESLPSAGLQSGDSEGSSPGMLRRSELDEEAFLSEVIVPQRVIPSDRAVAVGRSNSARFPMYEKVETSDGQLKTNWSTAREAGSRTPKSAFARSKTNQAPGSSPRDANFELAKKVSFDKERAQLLENVIDSQASVCGDVKRRGRPREKFYSLPIPVISDHSNVKWPEQCSGPLPGRRFGDTSVKIKDGNYNLFKTKSGKLDKQVSRFYSRRLSGRRTQDALPHAESDVPPVKTNVPAGRYFDALKGPELEILKDSEEILLPVDQQWPFLLRFPIGCFGISLGLGSQTMLWKTLASTSSVDFLHVPMAINMSLWCLAVIAFIAIFITYSLKLIFYFEAVRREYYHPVRINFFFAPWIACMFLTLGVPPVIATSLHPFLWCIFMFPILILELKIYGQWLSGGERRLSKVANPSTHLSLVGNFVGSLLAARVGWIEAAIFFWAVGLVHYLVVFVTLYQRLPTAEVLPKELHPVFFLFVAAPSAASVAWENIVGEFDFVSRIAYFIGLFLYCTLVVRLNFFRGFQFSVAWWAYTFPMTASAIATIHYSHTVRHPITQTLAVILTSIASITVFSLFVSTVFHAFFWGNLFPNDLAIAITLKKKGKKRHKFLGKNGSDSHPKGSSLPNGLDACSQTVKCSPCSHDHAHQPPLLSVKTDPLPTNDSGYLETKVSG